jgi:hypothetical protein
LTFSVQADEVCCREVLLQFLVVQIVLRISASISSVTYVTSFVLLPTVGIQLVISIESLLAEATLWMSLKSRLVDCSRVVVSVFLMLPKLTEREQFVFMGEHLFVPCAKVAHHLPVLALDMAVEVRPSQTSNITIPVRAVISE